MPALVSAVPFGATFTGVSDLALATGAHQGFPRSVALLRHGCHQALSLAASVVLAAAAAAAVLRIGFPHHMVVVVRPAPVRQPAPAETAPDAGTHL